MKWPFSQGSSRCPYPFPPDEGSKRGGADKGKEGVGGGGGVSGFRKVEVKRG